ncbi:MAG TPA: hypothetical protein PKC28_03710, partial [Bdellovibrionales bacterium]|nr:hypothetical protein [Bdellovibrionales bacterium]
GHWNILEKVLQAPTSSHVTVLAAARVEIAVQRHLKPANPSEPAAATAMTKNAGHFQRFQLILQDLVSTSKDQAVKDQATQALATLQSALSPVPTTTAGLQVDESFPAQAQTP